MNSLKPTLIANLMMLILMFIGFSMSSKAMAEVKASITQTSYYQGDPINLRIESNKSQNAEPDLSILEQNFDIKSTSANSQISIINGNRSYKKIWNIELQAKNLGELVIPEITLGKEKTEAITIRISELPPEIAAETKKHIFIEATVDIDNAEIYVQQQIPYTVKFYYDAAMQTGEVILPTIENANLRTVGNENKYQETRDGNNYVVVERRYVISPEKSGKLIIPPTIVQGRIAITNGDSPQLRKRMDEVDMLNELFFDLNNQATFNNPFDPFFSRRSIGPTRPYRASSETIEVNVLPVSKDFTGTAWLPAEEVIMQDSWTENPPILKVGEPVTRTIVMQVKGLASSQIPEIFIPKANGMKVYPEQAKGETPHDGNTIYGIQRVNITYIPDKSGPVIIPEITVDWWDVKNKKQETYVLPEWNLSVEAAENIVEETEVESDAMNDVNPEAEVSIEEVFIAAPSFWGWKALATLIIGVLMLLASIIYLFDKRYKKSLKHILKKKKHSALVDEKGLYTTLLRACETNNKHKAAGLLIEYSRLKHPESKILSLGALAKNLIKGNDVVKNLEASLYANQSEDWDGKALHQLITNGLQFKQQNQNTEEFALAPLYPN